MRVTEILVAITLVVLVCVLASSGSGDYVAAQLGADPAPAADGHRLYLFYVAAGSATLAGLLAEHGRRSNA